MLLYKMSNELNQCKELLRVQYNLNNKYKADVSYWPHRISHSLSPPSLYEVINSW